MKKIAIAAFVCLPFLGQAQATDIGLWSGVGVEKKITQLSVSQPFPHRGTLHGTAPVQRQQIFRQQFAMRRLDQR